MYIVAFKMVSSLEVWLTYTRHSSIFVVVNIRVEIDLFYFPHAWPSHVAGLQGKWDAET